MNEDFEFSWDFGETSQLKKSLEEIAKPCPILNPAPNVKTHLFTDSIKRLQLIAKEALKRK